MSYKTVTSLLKNILGINPDVVGMENITRAINKSMEMKGIDDINEYAFMLESSNQEIDRLIDNVIVSETWFFRDSGPFEFLAKEVQANRLNGRDGNKLRILCVPCSTGEEPYSIAMTLMNAGIPSLNFHIDAMDISHKSLRKAKQAVYSKNSFREQLYENYKHYFIKQNDEFKLIDPVCKSVNFLHGNLIGNFCITNELKYDIIFCRNVLIYLEKKARDKVINLLDSHLSFNGLIFMGHAETTLLTSPKFVRINSNKVFAFKKINRQIIPQCNKVNATLKTRLFEKKTYLPPQKRTNNSSFKKKHTILVDKKSETKIDSTLESAKLLADRGKLAEAADICENYLNDNGPGAQVFFLLGVINQALGNEKFAEQYFNKTIYLQPDHYDALVHMALILENRNEIDASVLLKNRAQRVKDAVGN